MRAFQGGAAMARFSSQIATHGKSLPPEAVASMRRRRRLIAAMNATSRSASRTPTTNPSPGWISVRVRSATPPSARGASGHWNSRFDASKAFPSSYPCGKVTPRVPGTAMTASPCARNGGPSVTCCVQWKKWSALRWFRTVSTKYATCSPRPQRDRPTKLESGNGQRDSELARNRGGCARGLGDSPARRWRFTVERESLIDFLRRRDAEVVETQVVAGNARQELALRPACR